MSGYLDDLQARLVEASRELSRARRRRARRRGAWCAAAIILVTPPALAATGVWHPVFGDGEGPGPKVSADAPPPDQLAALGVLRREQTAADRGVATRYALRFVDRPGLKVRTNSIRLLTESAQDRGVVLVPVERYERRLPGDIPEELRKRVERTIDDALCIYQLDSVDGAGVACYSTADVKEGRAWGMLGHRSLWIVPEGVATVRTEYADHDPILARVHDNAAIFTAPSGPPPASPVPGTTRSGVVRSIGVQADGAYQVRIKVYLNGSTLELRRPACAGKRRVTVKLGRGTGDLIAPIGPDWGDQRLTRWCPGTYRGFVRPKGARKPSGTFRFHVR